MAAELILAGLASIANDWTALAIAWHVLLAAMLLLLTAGWRPSARLLGRLLIPPIFSVSVAAWLSGNPFNATTFAIVAGVLAWAASRLSTGPIHFAARGWASAGVVLIAFGSAYPHFLRTDVWARYLYAAPLGLLPCPTLSVVIGMTVLVDSLHQPRWCAPLIAAGVIYGGFGVARLGVQLDWALLVASAILVVIARHSPAGPAATDPETPMTRWPRAGTT